MDIKIQQYNNILYHSKKSSSDQQQNTVDTRNNEKLNHDRVTISKESVVINKSEKEVMNNNSVYDENKVERIAKLIYDGDYVINADRIAEKMIQFDSLF